MTAQGFLVKEKIEGAHAKLASYPLLPEDLLVREPDGRFTKECPGIAVKNFSLTEEQIAALVPVKFEVRGLDYTIIWD